MFDSPHRRLNPLTREWVLVSPHRAKRPWLGQVEKKPTQSLPEYDPNCYLCPGNERAGGIRNPAYASTFVFDNDFAALLPEPSGEVNVIDSSLLISEPERGLCRVICFSPRHDLTLPELELSAIANVIATWAEQSADLGGRDFIGYVQVFENKGEVVTREKILQVVWGYNVYPATRTIDNFILSFRKYFEADSRNPRYFHSVRGVGYKFSEGAS